MRPQRVDHSRAIPLRLLLPVRSTARVVSHPRTRLGPSCGMPERTDKRFSMGPALLPRRTAWRSGRQWQGRWGGRPFPFAFNVRLWTPAGSRTRIGPIGMLGITLCRQRKAVHACFSWWWCGEKKRGSRGGRALQHGLGRELFLYASNLFRFLVVFHSLVDSRLQGETVAMRKTLAACIHD